MEVPGIYFVLSGCSLLKKQPLSREGAQAA